MRDWKFFTLLFLVAGLALVPSGCGKQLESDSKVQAIATDLPDNGTNAEVHLFWIFAGRIMRGDCITREPLIPRTCSNNVRHMDYGLFKNKLDNGLSQTIRDLSDEARSIQTALGRILAEMRPLQEEIARLEREGSAHSAELARLRHDMAEFQIYVTELQNQLRYIEDELRRAAADPDLRAQQALVVEQLGRYRNRLSSISGRIPALLATIKTISSQVDVLKTRLIAFNTRLDNLNVDLADVSKRLAVAYDDFSVYEDTLRRLESQVIYSALSTNTIVQAQRQFIKRFERIFVPGL